MDSSWQKRTLRAAAWALIAAATSWNARPAAAQGVPELRKRLDQEIAERQAADDAAAKAAQAATEAVRAQLAQAIRDGDAAMQKALLSLLEKAIHEEGSALRRLIADGDATTLAAGKLYTDTTRSALLDALALERAERLAERTLLEPRVLPPCGPNESVKFDGSSWVCVPTGDAGRPAPKPAARHAAILSLDGQFSGWLGSASGGKATLEGTSATGGSRVPVVTYGDIVVTLNLSENSDGLRQWLSDFVAARAPGLAAKSGTVYRLDTNGVVVGALGFKDSRIVSIEFPAIDQTSAGPCWLTLTLRPAVANIQKASSVPFELEPEPKQPAACACAVDLTGMPTARSVGPIAVKRLFATAQRLVEGVAIEALSITVASDEVASWEEWYESFVEQGPNGDDGEKSGVVVLLDASEGALARLSLSRVGITSMEWLAPGPQIAIGLYVEPAELVMPRPQ